MSQLLFALEVDTAEVMHMYKVTSSNFEWHTRQKLSFLLRPQLRSLHFVAGLNGTSVGQGEGSEPHTCDTPPETLIQLSSSCYM